MAGFDLTGSTGSMSTIYVAPYVALYADGQFTWLPNVRCVRISERIGPDPHTAHFRYIQDDALDQNFSWPSRFDEIWAPDANNPYVVQPDDRLVVIQQQPDGSSIYLFDGFAQIPQVDADGRHESASFTAISVAIREFDNPVSGRIQRDADPVGIRDTSGDFDVSTDLPARFNPADRSYGDDGGFQPNKTPPNFDTEQGTPGGHPVFVQEGIKGRTASKSPDYWSIAEAIKYLLAVYNPSGQWTEYPALSTLDEILAAAYNADGGPINDGDITSDPLLIRDYNAANKPYPEAIAELLGYAGFVMSWGLDTGDQGQPTTYLDIYRTDMLSENPVKQLYLDEPGNSLADGSRNNVARLRLARDHNAIVNAWKVETAQNQIEISVVLAPLYTPAGGDEQASNRKKFYRPSWDAQTSLTDKRKYRWYGADEIADGHWIDEGDGEGTFDTSTPFDFSPIFPPDEDGNFTYARRYRPGSNTLISLDDQGKPLDARLDISFDYVATGNRPELWNGKGTWYSVTGGWRLLDDRLGIEVTVEDPETNWTYQKGKILGVTWWASPQSASGDNFNPDLQGATPSLRLTTVIRDDRRIPVAVGKRSTSPTQFARWRIADARDHFLYATIDESSMNYNAQKNQNPDLPIDELDSLIVRDDTKAATDHARALQRAHEMPPLAGSVTLPGTVTYYSLGDRINYISGRNVQLYQNAGTAQGETPTYPVVVCREFHFDPHVYTELHLTDMRAAASTRNAY